MSLEQPRWRYFYDGQSPAKTVQKTGPSKDNAQQDDHIAHSVHTFYFPLSSKSSPSHAWGDLHLMWEDEYQSPIFHTRQIRFAKNQIKRLLNLYSIPKELVEYYINIYGVRIVVPASLFGGESGGQCRLKHEAQITKSYHCKAARNSVQAILRWNLPFVPRDGLCSCKVPFLPLRLRSIRDRSSFVGVSMPLSSAMR